MATPLKHLTDIDTAMQSILSERANCKGKYGLMFPDAEAVKRSSFSTLDDLEDDIARRICRGSLTGKECPVMAECLEYSIQNHEYHGVWGGLSSTERIRLFRRQRRNKLAS